MSGAGAGSGSSGRGRGEHATGGQQGRGSAARGGGRAPPGRGPAASGRGPAGPGRGRAAPGRGTPQANEQDNLINSVVAANTTDAHLLQFHQLYTSESSFQQRVQARISGTIAQRVADPIKHIVIPPAGQDPMLLLVLITDYLTQTTTQTQRLLQLNIEFEFKPSLLTLPVTTDSAGLIRRMRGLRFVSAALAQIACTNRPEGIGQKATLKLRASIIDQAREDD